ncbi:MAG: signal peptide peptidase SppA [Candidatus Diapherotrites archaeon]|nr:signal peptide peptidase SppA [Candidatus Diapherotrites archaeon]
MVNKWIFLTAVGILMLVGLAIVASFFYSSTAGSFSFGPKIARIALVGEIVSEGDVFQQLVSAGQIVDLLDQAENDSGVSAILLEINSPGGSVVATKQIVEKIQSMNKPVVSWISDIGASGAYYVSASTTYSMADEDSLTGSIGVITVLPDISGLLQDYNVKINVLTQGKFKDMGSPFKPLTEKEEELLLIASQQIFENFKNSIKSFRGDKLNLEQFESIADGRILTGRQAFELGLLDEVGGKQKAIQKAAELGNISGEPIIEDFSVTPAFSDIFSTAGQSFGQGVNAGLTNSMVSQTRSYFR